MPLQMLGITKHFPGVLANEGIDFDIEAGEVHALLGENGAGKSTLMNILYGIYQPDAGKIVWKGEEQTFHGPWDAIQQGIGMVHQHFTLIPVLTVAENVMLGRRSRIEPFFDARAAEQVVAEYADELGLSINPRARVAELDAGTQQWVEIIRALSRGAELLILDEPTSVLTPQEADRLLETIDTLTARGMGICFVTHKLRETMAIAGRVTVLRCGSVVGTLPCCDTNERELARMMVGRDILFHMEKKPAQATAPVLTLQDVGMVQGHRELLKQVTLEVKAGEIVGIAGVAGNGQTELAEAITGLRSVSSGHITLDGKDITHCTPRQIIEAGVAYIPDRPWQTATIREFNLEQNAILRSHWDEPMAQRGVLRRRAIAEHAKQLIGQYDVRAASSQMLAGQLSGGNLQKLVLARELAREPRLVIAVNPTAGLDVGAKEYIHQQLIRERENGKGVLLISADLDEVLELSDRLAVMYAGEIVGVVRTEEADIEEIGLMMAGAHQTTTPPPARREAAHG